MCERHRRTRREWLEVEAVDPADGKLRKAVISYDRLRFLGRAGRGHAIAAARCVPEVLRKPTAIYRGLLREEDQERAGRGWLCYCGLPGHAFLEDGTQVPPWKGFVFLVFVTDEGVVYSWRWEKADPIDPKLPLEREPERFKERLL